MLKKVLKNSLILQSLRPLISSNVPTVQSVRYTNRKSLIVLLPEVPENVLSSIQTENTLPNFNEITAKKLNLFVRKQSLEYESDLWSLEEKLDGSVSKSFEDIIDNLDSIDSQLNFSWSVAKTLYLVKNNDFVWEVYSRIHENAKRAKSRKYESEIIFKACSELNNDASLNEAQKRVIQKFLVEGKLNGLMLTPFKKEHFSSLWEQMDFLKSNYLKCIRYASEKFSYRILDESIVKEFPEKLLKSMSFEGVDHTLGPWTVTLNPLVYSDFLEYCPDKDLRRNAWRAKVSLCSQRMDPHFRNSVHMDKLISYRMRQAQLLGFKNYGEMSMETKMAKSTTEVFEFISALKSKSIEMQTKEISSLEEFAEENNHSGLLEESDISYWRRKQRITFTKNIDSLEIKKYFSFERVWNQLLKLCSNMLCVKFEEEDLDPINKWHPDVRFYRVLDAEGQELSTFFLDAFNRPNEKMQSNFETNWMIVVNKKSVVANTTPTANLVFNFPPLIDGVNQMTFEDVTALFEKFGQALQHLLSTFPYSQSSGITNVEWDATEVGSNFMLNWLYNPSVLKSISGHCETGELLSDTQIEEVLSARRHMSGFDLCKELFIADFDMQLYTEDIFWRDLMLKLYEEYSPYPMYIDYALFCSFPAIMTDVWPAAYYSHLWSRMLAADIYLAFQEVEPKDYSVIGKRFRDTYVSPGGGKHAAQRFSDFMGRDPRPEALIEIYAE